jgi:hypothetical protein
MSSADWVAAAGVLVSCLAFAVSFYAYQLQQKTAKSDNEKELADQIDAILAHLAQIGAAPPNPEASAAGTAPQTALLNEIARTGHINDALHTLVLRVGALLESTRVQPDWYQNLILALAAVQINELVMAGPYAEAAVNLAMQAEDRGWKAEMAALAQMLSLRAQANFYYSRGRPEDIELGRAGFKAARKRARDLRQQQGPFATVARLVDLYLDQADLELCLGEHDRGAELTAKACHVWQEVKAPGSRQQIGRLICSYALGQTHVPANTLLPGEFVKEWEGLQHQLGSTAPAGHGQDDHHGPAVSEHAHRQPAAGQAAS